MTFPTFRLQELLGNMFRNEYKNDPVIQKHILELGWAIDRLIKRNEITPFDDYEVVMKKALKEMDWSAVNGTQRREG
ncbi:hypothetical protein [Staphylococcus debuckii]|uniref:hypothetical protein n=1 Tax=Staphylococcus debuckii TaxID=2044912 RepID=UPI000F4335A9|nr:hypothetical protein [Staphylococcus debuckii]AYU54657.1 hypothetical protein CNQ82_04130 [Staphylococcus debuckii]